MVSEQKETRSVGKEALQEYKIIPESKDIMLENQFL